MASPEGGRIEEHSEVLGPLGYFKAVGIVGTVIAASNAAEYGNIKELVAAFIIFNAINSLGELGKEINKRIK
jgi:hypothetical protein